MVKKISRWLFKAYLPFLVAFFIPSSSQSRISMFPSRGEAGIPYIKNYTPKEYGRHAQNWAIVQDRRGIMYFGNEGGVLEYDGVSWRTIYTRNRSRVRSLALDSTGRICVGGVSDLGYLEPDNLGRLQFQSLLSYLKKQDSEFGDVAKIHATRDGVYFQTFSNLFRWFNDTINVIKPQTQFHLSFAVHNKLFIRQVDVGLMRVVGDSLVKVPDGERFAQERIYAMLPYDQNSILIASRTQGLFLFDGLKIVPFHTDVDSFLVENQIYHGTVLSEGSIALATIRGGVVVVNKKGTLQTMINKSAGLQDENVWYLFPDGEAGLWLALNNGIARVEVPSPHTIFDERTGLKGAVESVVRHQGILYAATDQGVFRLEQSKSRTGHASSYSGLFRFIPGISTQCWSLLSVGQSLLVATNNGVYDVRDDHPRQINKLYSFFLYRSSVDSNRIYVGLQRGFTSLRWANGHWNDEGIVQGINEEIRSILETLDGKVWLTTHFVGVLRLDFSKGYTKTPRIEHFTVNDGLPHVVGAVFSISGQALFDTEKGIYRSDESTNSFVPYIPFTASSAETTGIVHRLFPYGKDRILIDAKHGFFLFTRLPDSSYNLSEEPTLHRITQNLELLRYVEGNGVVWLGGTDGLVRYDPSVKKSRLIEFTAHVRKVTAIEGDSLMFGGVYVQSEDVRTVIPYELNELRFEYASPSFDDESANQYQYYLQGFDKHWSPWTKEAKKDYTNIPPCNYTFRVRARNIYELQSLEATYKYRVLPPWYRTWWSYTSYTLFGVSLILGAFKWRLQALERKARILEVKVEQRTVQLKQKSEALEQEKKKSDELLHNILPDEVAEELKAQGRTTPHRYEQITVMFTDFKGFTNVAAQLPADRLVQELDDMYRHFDDILEKYGLEKIKSIGDSYMIAGGLPKETSDHALQCIRAANDMLGYLKERNRTSDLKWEMRVGIDTGPAFAGVVGKKKFTYDVWGDTVNLASRMESSGEPGRINISSSTHELVKDCFDCEYRGKVDVKGKSQVDMYFV